MKKLLTLVLVMVLVLTSLTACSVDEIKGKVTDTFNGVKESVSGAFDTVKKTVGGWFGIEFPEETPEEPEVTYDVEAAKDYVYQLYVKGSYETPSDYTVVKQVFIKKVAHDVTWTTSSELVKVIVNENDVTIDVDEKSAEELVYTLTATITAADGTSATVSFERKVPKYELLGYAQYLEKATGEAVTVEGIVTLARSQGAGNKRDQLFIQDMNGINGYYVYYTDKDYVKELGLKVGMKVSVTGIKEIYGATHEIKEGVVTILDETITTLTPNDITELFKTNTDPKAPALLDRLGSLVTIKGVVIGAQDLADSSKYLYFEMENGCKTYVRVYTTDLGVGVMNAEQEKQVFADHLAKRDYLANVTGVVDVYSDAIYISPVSATPFEFLEKVERTPAEKINLAISELEVPKSIEQAGEITLPTAGTTYPEVKFAWSTDSELIAIDGGKLTVTLPEETTTVTITVKASCEGATDVEKTYDIKIYALATDLYVPSDVKAPAKDVAYKLYLAQNNIGETLYFAGAMNGNFLATITDAANATDVYLEEVVDGETVVGFRMYFMDGEAKKYIDAHEYQTGKVGIRLTAEPTCVWTFDATLGVMTTTVCEKIWYLGTYSTYNTMSLSETWRISGEKAGDVGVSQFPAKLATLAPAAYAPSDVKAPAKDVAYKLYLAQNNIGETLYFAGAMNGNFLATITDAANATDVYLEEVVDGETVVGFRMYFMDGEAKKYIDAHEYQTGKVGIRLTAEPTCVWTFDATLGVMTTTVCEKIWYLGTYSTYNTMSLSETWRISGEKAGDVGVSQFPAKLATLLLKEIGPKDVETPVKDTEYKLYLAQNNIGETLYFAGAMNGNFLATTTKISQAVAVYLEEVLDGETVVGFRMYFMDGEAKKYIDAHEYQTGKVGIRLTAEPTCVWTFDAALGVMTTTVCEKIWYLGTYSTYNTMSLSETWRISGDKAGDVGVSQFPAKLATIEFVKDEVVEPDTPDTPVEPEKPDTPVEPEKPDANIKDVDLTASGLGLSNSYAEGTATVSGFGFQYIELGDYGNGIQMRTKNGKSSALWNTVAFTKGIKMIELTYNAAKLNAEQGALKTISNAIKFTFGNELGAETYTANLSTVAGQGTYTIIPDKDTYTFFKLLHTASNSFYFDSIKIYFELPCAHAYDAVCDDTCNLCGETRTAEAHKYTDCTDATCNNEGCKVTREAKAEHVYDKDCTDATCNNEGCTVTREAAAAHVYDKDCTDATCNNEGCEVTREAAAAHVYDKDCTDATCNNEGCEVTREAKAEHVYDNDCTDATCNNEGCEVTREAAAEHVYDDCNDTTCANCAVTREAQPHVYTGCDDATCENCDHTREAGNHNFTGKCGNSCTECGAADPNAKTCVDSDKNGHCDNCGCDMDEIGDTPVVDN